MPKARSKPCRHCLYGNNHLGTKERVEEAKGAIASGVMENFCCHEHTDKTFCHGFAKRYPERLPMGTIQTNANGARKAVFSHMSRQQLSACGNEYLGFGKEALDAHRR